MPCVCVFLTLMLIFWGVVKVGLERVSLLVSTQW